jgi:hypothetical protein
MAVVFAMLASYFLSRTLLPLDASSAHLLCRRSFVFYDILALFRRFCGFAGVFLFRTLCRTVEPHELAQFLRLPVVRLILGRDC